MVSATEKKKNPFHEERSFITRDFSGSDCCGFIQLLGQTGLLAVCGVLMDNTLARSLVNHSGSRGQLHIGVGRVGSNSSIKLANGGTHTALHNTIPQILFLADLYALFGGLDIRQLGSPPLRILKKPSHGIISCLQAKSNPFRKKYIFFPSN